MGVDTSIRPILFNNMNNTFAVINCSDNSNVAKRIIGNRHDVEISRTSVCCVHLGDTGRMLVAHINSSSDSPHRRNTMHFKKVSLGEFHALIATSGWRISSTAGRGRLASIVTCFHTIHFCHCVSTIQSENSSNEGKHKRNNQRSHSKRNTVELVVTGRHSRKGTKLAPQRVFSPSLEASGTDAVLVVISPCIKSPEPV